MLSESEPESESESDRRRPDQQQSTVDSRHIGRRTTGLPGERLRARWSVTCERHVTLPVPRALNHRAGRAGRVMPIDYATTVGEVAGYVQTPYLTVPLV